jgi:hypothetical protein
VTEEIGIAAIAVCKCEYGQIEAAPLASDEQMDLSPVKLAYLTGIVVLAYVCLPGFIPVLLTLLAANVLA